MLSSSSFTAPATTAIYTLSLHDALPIWGRTRFRRPRGGKSGPSALRPDHHEGSQDLQGSLLRPPDQRTLLLRDSQEGARRSDEHTSELQSRFDLACRLLLEKQNKPRKSI